MGVGIFSDDFGTGYSSWQMIRKLAEQSTKFTKELKNNSKSAVDVMERVSSILEEQEMSVKKSQEKYWIINEAMKNINLIKRLINFI
ncbi:hypothetical protein [Alteribacter keqinensis]|uniref:EAL domain-containing protein n=1 Tax=Alteribacter keqinensis TaxID=2483800 RepID=A0A3M7TQQ8_9BACI|nr:hypothetical protein [Alteribacter keqinensis]RNA67597.1 hypothetical protein EBO34_12800 [Alteribacter keqinensis]